MRKLLALILLLSLSLTAHGSATRKQTADSLVSSDASKTWTLPSATGTLLNQALTSGLFFVGNGSNIATGVAASGDLTLANTGAFTLANSGVSAGSCTNCNLTIDAKGRVTVKSSGTGGSSISDELRLDTANGYGSTNTLIRRFSTVTTNTTSGTYTDSASLGGSFTVNTAGIYTVDYQDSINGGNGQSGYCATLNDLSVSTACLAQATGSVHTLMQISSPNDGGAGGFPAHGSWTGRLAVNDVIRFKTQGGPNPSPNISMAKITRIGD